MKRDRITTKEIVRLSALARLQFTECEKLQLSNKMCDMLEFIDKINELDTDGVIPTFSVCKKFNVFREDVAAGQMEKSKILQNAPETDGRCFIVPKM